MSFLRLIIVSLIHHWRSNLAIALGVAAATAVLTGALLVGDSVRGSLRDLTLDRLGRIDEVLVTDRFFRAELAAELAQTADSREWYESAHPAILLQGSLKNQATGNVVGGVSVVGVDEGFWKLGRGAPDKLPRQNEIVINDRLAAAGALQVNVGDTVILQVGQPSNIPADSPLGTKTETVRRQQLTVSAIIPTEGLGRFGLSPSQQLPANAFVNISTLQALLDADARANAVIVGGKSEFDAADEEASLALARSVKPQLSDYGLRLDRVQIGDAQTPIVEYFNLTTDRMLLEDAVVEAARPAWANPQPQSSLTYLANWIASGERRIPYSTITAIDSTEELGPLLDESGEPILLADDEIVLNNWAADDLGVEPGAEISVTYFEPDTTHGEVQEGTASFRLKAVVKLAEGDAPRTAANDPALTPEVPGITDQESIDNWNPPFPFDSKRVRDKDDQYWKDHRGTPKAFVSLAAGKRLWGSRFGEVTSIRIAQAPDMTVESLAVELLGAIEPERLGFKLLPVKRLGLQAASGTTPFDVLFLLFSMFLIAAALMLVSLLFRLGVEQRAEQIGLLLALGLSRRQVRNVIAAEALLVAIDGAVLGAVIGIGYAWLMLTGLRTLWVKAVTTPFLQLHVTWPSLLIGAMVGVLVCGLTILWTVRRLRRVSVRRLLSGEADEATELLAGRVRRATVIAMVCLLSAVALVPLAWQLGGEAQAGAFFGAGALVLVAALVWIAAALRSRGVTSISLLTMSLAGLLWLALCNVSRNPGRSTLTVGLMAAATFLIVAVSSFRLDQSDAGSGGFDLFATADVPLYFDLGSDDGRFELGVSSDSAKLLAEASTVALRVKPGDDASCLNLYRPRQPRVLGVPAGMPGEFLWAMTAETEGSPWQLLEQDLPPDEQGRPVVPVVIDQNTAYYSLQLWQGVGATLQVSDSAGSAVTLQVVGLLKNSVFQGDLLISESNFLKLFPSVSGYRLFLICAPEGKSDELRVALENDLADFGFDAIRSRDRLAGFFAVQNTYLSTFQSLGGLGLLLGTFGLAAVQLRNVITRRGELALLRATGFRRARLAAGVLLENGLLLVTGLAVGILASLVSVLPHLLSGSAKVPWSYLAGTLGLVLLVGIVAGLAAVRATLRAPVIAALRGD